MSTVKSFSVGEGDMFYIDHNSDNFTTIDCCFDYKDGVKDSIIQEINKKSRNKLTRFISTHPHDDHISGLVDFCKKIGIVNFYSVENEATAEDETEDFVKYCELRDGKKAYYLKKGISRRWFNEKGADRKSSDISCLWPIPSNEKYKTALDNAKNGGDPNNISPAIRYATSNFSFLWMGDMETDMQKEFDASVANKHTTIVFAPHHGRSTGKIPKSLLNKLTPNLIIVGEADSEDLEYYNGYNTITQNTAGDIQFEIGEDYIDIYVSEENYTTSASLVENEDAIEIDSMYYLGSIE
jgi:beta-lactamase superfamily II metal-dependent hydrolase